MTRAALDERVPLTHQDLVVVDQGGDLAADHVDVVDRVGRVEAEVRVGRLGLDLEDTEQSAVRVRQQTVAPGGDVPARRVGGGRLRRRPQLRDLDALAGGLPLDLGV